MRMKQGLRPGPLLALPGADDRGLADLLDEVEAHVGHGGGPVHAALVLHLDDDVLQHLPLVLVQGQLIQDQLVPLHRLAGGEAHGEARPLGVVLDEVDDAVKAAVDGAVVVPLVAEILAGGPLLVLGDVQGVLHQLVHALVLGGGDGHHGHAQELLHAVHVHGAAVGGDLVHHVHGHHHGHVHLQELDRQIEVPLDVGGVHDVDDGRGLLIKDEAEGLGMALDDAVLPIHGDAGEVAHVLVGAGELVEEGGLPRVLVADESEGQRRALGQRVPVALAVILAALPKTRVLALLNAGDADVGIGALLDGLDLDLGGVGHAQRQLVAVDLELHGIAQGGQLHHRDLGPGDHAHVQKVLPQGPFPAYGADHGGLADGELI